MCGVWCVCACVCMYVSLFVSVCWEWVSKDVVCVLVMTVFAYNVIVRYCDYDLNSSSAAIQVWFASQNYTVTEGDGVNITLVTSSSAYMFDFTVTLQAMNGAAVGECLSS